MKNTNLTLMKLGELSNSNNTKLIQEIIIDIWNNQSLSFGGVINYHSKISNAIKFFTQSIFSHINFVSYKKENKNYKVIGVGAEDFRGIVNVDYSNFLNKSEEFYYIIKQLNLDLIVFLYDFKYAENVYLKIYKDNISIRDKFDKYCYYRLKSIENKISLEEAISYFDEKLNEIDNSFCELKLNIDNFLNQKDILRKQFGDNFDNNFIKCDSNFNKYFKLLKEFFLIGVIKYIINRAGTQYDLKGTLSIWKSAWKYTNIENGKEFCSEFVSNALLYSGFYPFDINTKSPSSISPGDILDSSFLFKNNLLLFQINKGKLETISEGNFDKGNSNSFKDIILKREENKFYFKIQKLKIELFLYFIDILLKYGEYIAVLIIILAIYFKIGY